MVDHAEWICFKETFGYMYCIFGTRDTGVDHSMLSYIILKHSSIIVWDVIKIVLDDDDDDAFGGFLISFSTSDIEATSALKTVHSMVISVHNFRVVAAF